VARIVSFKEIPGPIRSRPHSEVECGYTILTEDGRTLLQLETYGSDRRQIPGKVSQSIQIDEEAARMLSSLIRRTFPRSGT
jgi:hypothetical protein